MGRGGSRWGAGRPGYRVKAEQLQRIEIGRWHRGGYLRQGTSFSWSWNCGGEPTGSRGVRIFGADSLRLEYTVTTNDDPRDGSQTIRLARTECHYGGGRPWFVCPVCQRRAGLLFLRAGRLACRHCQRVAYTSQSSDALDRTWLEQSKIEARLDKHWQRPSGMRYRTYERLIDVLEDCEYRRNLAFCNLAARLMGR